MLHVRPEPRILLIILQGDQHVPLHQLKHQVQAHNEQHESGVRDRKLVPNSVLALFFKREQSLDALDSSEDLVRVHLPSRHHALKSRDVRGDEGCGDGVDEEASFGAADGFGCRGEDGGDVRVCDAEVGNEFEEDKGFGNFGGGRGGVGGVCLGFGTAIGYGWDLKKRMKWKSKRRKLGSLTLLAGLTRGAYHSGLFWMSTSKRV